MIFIITLKTLALTSRCVKKMNQSITKKADFKTDRLKRLIEVPYDNKHIVSSYEHESCTTINHVRIAN